MAVGFMESPPVTRRTNDVTVKVDAESLRQARISAAIRDQSLAEFVSDVLLKASLDVQEEWKKAGEKPLPSKKGK